MKIRGWQVEGYGVFCDYNVKDLPGSLVVVHGPNEAGKSTLLAFIRGVLFGFSDRRGSETTYSPLRGGRHGGALLIENADGLYRVERLGGRRNPLAIVRPDHSEGGEGDLQQLLGGADRQLFKSVFAFSLQDLAGMEMLSSDQVRARIFSAGIAGAGRSAREVIDSLQKEAAILLSPRAGKIRELVREAHSLSDQIGAAVRRASEYRDALRLEEEAGVQVARLRREFADAEARVRRAATLIDIWPTESERLEAIRSLEDVPTIDSFPADAEERLAAALADVRTATRSWQEADRSLQQLLQQRRDIELDDRLLRIATAATDRLAECSAHRDRLNRMIELVGALQQHENRVVEVLRDLGSEWTEARLALFDVSLPAAEEVRDWDQRVETAKHDSDGAATALASFDKQSAGVEESLERISSDLEKRQGALTEDDVRGVSARLATVGEAIGALEARSPRLIFDPSPLDIAAAALATARQEYARLGTISEDAEVRLQKIVADEPLVSLQVRVNEAARHVEVERQRLRDIENLEVTRRERKETVERSIRELGDSWTEARASAIPSDFAQLQQVRDFAAQLADDRERVIGAERELDHVGKGRSGHEKDLQRLRDQLSASEPTSMDTLEKQSRSLRRLRTRLAEVAQIEGDRRAEERVSAEAVGEEPTTPDVVWIRWVSRVGGAIAVGLAFFAVWRVLLHDAVGGIVLAAACLLIALLAIGLHLRIRTRPSKDDIARRQHRLDEARRQIADLDRRGAELRDAIAEDARFLDLPNLPTLDQVEDRQEEWFGERDARRRRDDLSAEASRQGQELESWRESEIRRRAECEEVAKKVEESVRSWQAWLAAKGLSPGMTPDAARDLLQQVRSLQDRIAERNATVERLLAQQTTSVEWRTNAEEILAGSNDAEVSAIDLGVLFERILDLQRRCGEEASRARERASLEQEVADWNKKLADARREVLRAKDEAVSAVRMAYERVVAEWRSTGNARNQEKNRLETIAAKFESTSRDWETWQESRGLDRRMSPDGVLDFFASVRRGRDEIEHRDRIRAEFETLRVAVSGWERQVAELLSAAGLKPPEGTADSWIDAAREVAQRCTSNAEACRQAQGLDAAIAGGDLELEVARQERDAGGERLAALFAEACVSSQEEFRIRLAQYRCREALKRKITELETRIVTVLGSGDEAVRLELGTGRVPEWTTERSQWSFEAESLREQHEGAIRRHQDLANARHQLEEAADVAELELQLQAVRDELDASVRRRRVTSLAAALVFDTLREFERTRQPAVLSNASEAFERVTDGRYTKIVQTEDTEGVVVLDRRGARHTVGQLSRGTQEQLYLSMRLGLAREFAQRAVPLPLVMDDVLVNFDEARARRMAMELMEFAATQQVLLFTCHTFVRSMLLDLNPDVCVIDLAVHDIAGGEPIASQREVLGKAERLEPISSAVHENDVLNALAAAGPLSLPELVERLESDPDRVRRVLAELRENGQVVLTGQKRGARYALGAAAEA